MARLIPEADDAELSAWSSAAERRVYLACRTLPAGWLVIHGLRTLSPDDRGVPRDGEADFTIFDPDRGLLCIEVKGGWIRYNADKDKWFGPGKGGAEAYRTDPFLQAMKRKKDLGRLLTESPAWRAARAGNLPSGHAVLFADLDDLPVIQRPDAPFQVIGGNRDVADLEGWIDRVFRYWDVQQGRSRPFPDGTTKLVESVLAAPFAVQPQLGVRIELETENRSYWTERQWDILQSWPTAGWIAVKGGAGTGKTVLAVRKAQQLAEEGKRVALLCFNKPLADHLRLENLRFTRVGGAVRDAIETMSFDAFARYWLQQVHRHTGRDHLADARRHYPQHRQDEAGILLPIALAWALDDDRPEYDAIIVDEGQDFGGEHWNAIETLARDRHLAIMYDPNQKVYRREARFPVPDERTFRLHRNCRNTDAIHDAAYVHYDGPRVDRPAVVGAPVRRWSAAPGQEADRIAENLAGLIARERVRPEDLTVLLLDARRKAPDYATLEPALRRHGVPFVRETHGDRGSVLIETAGRFKGLECAVVVLWVNGVLPEDERRKFMYVAQSRARSLLVIVGDRTSSGP